MTEAEAIVFESNPDFNIYISMRRFDEQAKVLLLPLPLLSSLLLLLSIPSLTLLLRLLVLLLVLSMITLPY